MNPKLLRKLADRCEREKPSQELNNDIGLATGVLDQFGGHYFRHPFTTSIDSAVTLVPAGKGYILRSYGDGAGSAIIADPPRDVVRGRARVGRTIALALCAAALRARAAIAEQTEEMA